MNERKKLVSSDRIVSGDDLKGSGSGYDYAKKNRNNAGSDAILKPKSTESQAVQQDWMTGLYQKHLQQEKVGDSNSSRRNSIASFSSESSEKTLVDDMDRVEAIHNQRLGYADLDYKKEMVEGWKKIDSQEMAMLGEKKLETLGEVYDKWERQVKEAERTDPGYAALNYKRKMVEGWKKIDSQEMAMLGNAKLETLSKLYDKWEREVKEAERPKLKS